MEDPEYRPAMVSEHPKRDVYFHNILNSFESKCIIMKIFTDTHALLLSGTFNLRACNLNGDRCKLKFDPVEK